LILISVAIRIAAAHVAHDMAIDSDHALVLLSVPLDTGHQAPAAQEYRSATRKYSSNRLTNGNTRNKFMTRINAVLADGGSCLEEDWVAAIGQAVTKAASEILPLLDHKRDSELVGVA
jgi:hypothetical protein